MRAVIRMDLSQHFGAPDNIFRSKSQDWQRVLAVAHLIGSEIPFERHHASGPERLLEPGLPVQKCDPLKPSLAEKRGKNQRTERDGQDARLSRPDTLLESKRGDRQKCRW